MAPAARRALLDLVRRRAGPGTTVGEGALDAVLDLVASTGGTTWRARTRPAGTDLLAGHAARGTVVELAGPDRPLVVTSVEEELRARGVRVAQVSPISYGARRDDAGALVEVGPARGAACPEAVLQVEAEAEVPDAERAGLVTGLLDVLGDIEAVTRDHDAMRSRLTGLAVRVAGSGADVDADAVATIRWLLDGNALLLGLAQIRAGERAGGPPDLGLFRSRHAADLHGAAGRTSSAGPERPVVISRLPRTSPVHRRVPMLRLDVWAPADDGGDPVVERLVWVVARRAAGAPLSSVPVLRHKLDRLLEREDVVPGSYDEQHLTLLFQSLPEDDLFSLDVDALHALVHELRAEDRDHSVRVVLRPTSDAHAVAALVTVPVERWTRGLRERLERFLRAQLDGERVDVALSIGGGSSSVTARFLVHQQEDTPVPGQLDAVAREVRLLCRSWEEQLAGALGERADIALADGPEALAARWAAAVPESYRDAVAARDAVLDVAHLDEVARRPPAPGTHTAVWFGGRRAPDAPLRLGLVADRAVELSRLLPALESLGLWVADEARWAVGDLWLHHLGVDLRARSDRTGGPRLEDPEVSGRVASAVDALLAGRAERDGLNRLVVAAGLGWDDVGVLRAYRRYRHQVDARDDEAYVDDVLVGHPEVARLLVALWHVRTDPDVDPGEREALAAAAARRAQEACDALPRLDHDRILRGLAGTIEATLRTNRALRPEGPLALKLDPSLVPGAPHPRPYREVFVSGRTVQGVHLRAGPVARGGIRASDRPQDHRSEVLDLMRTQVLKNAVIVPTGAKGGFVVRPDPDRPDEVPSRERVAAAYDAFVGALLDVTDDLDGDRVVPVPGRWDGDDPYLVVAADKGTASFSDRANDIAVARGFWLGDAFASGGSHGYDHKALGITARGAWVAIARHLRSLGLDAHRDEISVVGVGDMSGDVFGNGMLHSDRLRLVAAFDHRHVFLDPDPDPAPAFAERRRLFELPGSSWADYDTDLLSPGGGVHPRTAKAVDLTPEARAALRVDAERMTPAELVRAVLCAPVDLLYFGGIGTYVRASVEDDGAIDDRANAEVRITGRDLRARVVGEGANLALTQRARVEVARRGARLNADAIDNAAGVDCSDHEVNLKILLSAAIEDGRLDAGDRDALLTAHADDVVEAVLSDCAAQSEALDRAERSTASGMATIAVVLRLLVAEGVLDPDVEALPTDPEIEERMAAGAGFTRPELAVLLAGVKRRTTSELLASDVPDHPVLREALVGYFPPALAERFDAVLDRHRLRRELVASEVANDLVDHLGLAAVVSLADELGVGVAEIALAHWVARSIVGAPERWRTLARRRGATVPDLAPDPVDGGDLLAALLRTLTRGELARRRREERGGGTWDPAARIADDRPVAEAVAAFLASDPDPDVRRTRSHLATRLVAGGLDPEVAERAADAVALEVVPDVAEVARDLGRDPIEVLLAFRQAASALGLDDLRRRIEAVDADGQWAAEARQGLLDDVVGIRRETARRALAAAPGLAPGAAVDAHLAGNAPAVAEALAVRRRLAQEAGPGLDGLAVAVRAARRAAL